MSTNEPQTEEFKGREYLLESDAEGKRLRQQHAMFKAANGNKLILAPVDLIKSNLRILDIGTYDGHFLRDLYTNFLPAAVRNTDTLVGVDLLEIHFPTAADLPAGSTFHFQKQDINEPWPKELLGSFDLVHQRLMLAGAGPNTRATVLRALELVKPGGWIQFMEAEQVVGSDDGPAMHDWLKLMGELFGMMGVPMTYARSLHTWLEEEGFEDVGTRLVPTLYGAKEKDDGLRKYGYESLTMAVAGILGHVGKIPGGLKGLTKEECGTLIERLMKELAERGGEYPMRYAWGRKRLAV